MSAIVIHQVSVSSFNLPCVFLTLSLLSFLARSFGLLRCSLPGVGADDERELLGSAEELHGVGGSLPGCPGSHGEKIKPKREKLRELACSMSVVAHARCFGIVAGAVDVVVVGDGVPVSFLLLSSH